MLSELCWRCGKAVEAKDELAPASCPFCAAILRSAGSLPVVPTLAQRPDDTARTSAGFRAMLWTFGLLLLTSVVYGASILQGAAERDPDSSLAAMLVIEGVDTFIIVFGWLWMRRASGIARFHAAGPGPWQAWLLSIPLLAAALGLNFLYHGLLLEYVGNEAVIDPIIDEFGLSALVLVAYCVQPAIIEELFFRHVALGKLRDVASPMTALYLSSLMFGLCHLFSPLSVPYLILMGGMLGYLRLKSGSLLLPILVHFLHNLIVTWMHSPHH